MLRMLYAQSIGEKVVWGKRQIKISRKTHLKPLAKLTHTHTHTHADTLTDGKTIKWYFSRRCRRRRRQTALAPVEGSSDRPTQWRREGWGQATCVLHTHNSCYSFNLKAKRSHTHAHAHTRTCTHKEASSSISKCKTAIKSNNKRKNGNG